MNNTDSLLVIATKTTSHLQFLIEEMLAETDNLQRGLKCNEVQIFQSVKNQRLNVKGGSSFQAQYLGENFDFSEWKQFQYRLVKQRVIHYESVRHLTQKCNAFL